MQSYPHNNNPHNTLTHWHINTPPYNITTTTTTLSHSTHHPSPDRSPPPARWRRRWWGARDASRSRSDWGEMGNLKEWAQTRCENIHFNAQQTCEPFIELNNHSFIHIKLQSYSINTASSVSNNSTTTHLFFSLKYWVCDGSPGLGGFTLKWREKVSQNAILSINGHLQHSNHRTKLKHWQKTVRIPFMSTNHGHNRQKLSSHHESERHLTRHVGREIDGRHLVDLVHHLHSESQLNTLNEDIKQELFDIVWS